MTKHLLFPVLGLAAMSAMAQTVDPSKLLYTVGDGTMNATVVAQWNDDSALENLAWGVRFETGTTAGDAVRSLLKADPRFYAGVTAGKTVGYAFDLNGDGDVALKNGETLYKPVDGIVDLPAGVNVMPADSISDQWAVGDWRLIRGGKVIGESEVLADGDIVYLSRNSDTPVEHDYVMYVPAPDEKGVWFPEAMTLPIADQAYIRYIVGTGGLPVKTLSFYRKTDEGKTDATAIKTLKWDPVVSAARALPNFAGTPESVGKSVNISARIYLTGDDVSYRESANACKVTIAAPEVPVSRIYFREPEMNVRLDHEIDWLSNLVIEPENATYTALTGAIDKQSPAVLSWTSTRNLLKSTTTPGTGTFTLTHAYAGLTASLSINTSCFVKISDMRFCDEEIERTRTIRTTMFDTPEFEFGTGYEILPEDPDCIKYCTLQIKDWNKETSLAGIMQTKISHEKWGVVYKYVIQPSGLGNGEETLVLKCDNEDTGKVYKEYKLIIGPESTSIDEVSAESGRVYVEGRDITVSGCKGVAFNLYTVGGTPVLGFMPDSDMFTISVDMPAGLYILRGGMCPTQKIVVR